MRNFKTFAVIVGLSLTLGVFAGCGQNAHVLGTDPSVGGPVTGPIPDGNPGEPGKGDEQQGPGKDQCPTVLSSHEFDVRPLRDGEHGPLQATYVAFAVDVNLSQKNIALVRNAYLHLEGVDPASVESTENAICLLNYSICTRVTAKESYDLLKLFPEPRMSELLAAQDTLKWAVPASLGMKSGKLWLEVLEYVCPAPKEGDKKGGFEGQPTPAS